MSLFRNSILSLIITFSIVFSSCTKNDDNVNLVPVQKDSQITISMKHMVANEMVDFDSIQYANTFGNMYSIITLNYFVSDFRFQKDDGTSIFIDQEFYVDATDETTITFKPTTKLPSGDYTSISFVFGLNSTKNVSGAFLDPPENAMEWPLPLGGGYHYMKLEGKVDSAGVINNFQAHTGATNGNLNHINVTLPASSFSVDKESIALSIVMDINKWWTNPNLLDLNEITGIMGNQDMQEKLKANGQDVFTIDSID